jgi:hypothetical protein
LTFLNKPGVSIPVDAVVCSRFSDPEDVTCEKKCMEMAETRAAPSSIVARLALPADGRTGMQADRTAARTAAGRRIAAPTSPLA